MPDTRADSSASRRWRLFLLMTGVALTGAAAVLRSSVERLHEQIGEVRRLRARLAERRHEVDRRRHEMMAVATAVDGLVPSLVALGNRSVGMCQASEPSKTGTVPLDAIGVPTSRVLTTLAWAEEQSAAACEAFAVQGVLLQTKAHEARSVPALWPVEGTVTSPFGWRRSPYGDGWEWHPGVDIVAAYGAPVRATADGEVVSGGLDPGYGLVVVVDHGAAMTRYAHLSATSVRAGQMVRCGEPLGALGGTGRATAPHLHYEVRLASEALDPECFLVVALAGIDVDRRPSAACVLARARVESQISKAALAAAERAMMPRAGGAG
jgi:hypothetical protein